MTFWRTAPKLHFAATLSACGKNPVRKWTACRNMVAAHLVMTRVENVTCGLCQRTRAYKAACYARAEEGKYLKPTKGSILS
jgi:hypothetical protein